MLFRSQNANILIECASVRIARIKDRETQVVKKFNIVGTMPTGRDVTLARYDLEEDAKLAMERLYAKIIKKNDVIDMATI